MKKRIAFFACNLDVGGIERAIINFVNNIDKSLYDVTLFLEKKEGIYLDNVNSDVKIIDYGISRNKFILFRKISNLFRLIYFSIRYYHKFDFACNFATSIKSGAILAKRFSLNNAIWIHGEYWHTKEEAEEFLKYIRCDKYKKIVFVSNKLKDNYLEVRPNSKKKLYVLNNIMNYKEIIEKSNDKIDVKKDKITFLNVGRHEECSKNLTMLFRCIKRLCDDGYDFSLWLVGSGNDTEMYKNMISDLKLNDVVKFLGTKSNVFPYYKVCDAVLLSSVSEGNPVVYLEAKTLNKPIISTDISDAKIELDGYGIVVPCNEDDYYMALKDYLDNGYKIKKKFNPEEFNQDKLNKLYSLMEEEW